MIIENLQQHLIQETNAFQNLNPNKRKNSIVKKLEKSLAFQWENLKKINSQLEKLHNYNQGVNTVILDSPVPEEFIEINQDKEHKIPPLNLEDNVEENATKHKYYQYGHVSGTSCDVI